MKRRVVVRDISEFPEGRGLEKPLHPKRQRKWQPKIRTRQPPLLQPKLEPLLQAKLEPLVVQPKLEPQSQPTPTTPLPAKLSPSPAPPSPSPSPAPPSPSPAPLSPSPASPSQYMPPSPAMFIECGNASMPPSPQHQTPPSGRRSLKDTDRSCLANCGSDDDMEEDDDEEKVPILIPRVYQSLLDTPLDKHPTLATATTVPTENLESPDVSLTLQPRNLFDFDWRNFPSNPIPPESRREKFSNIKVGPTTPCVDPFEIFTQIWDRQIMEHIVKETNKYAQEVVAQMIENNTLRPQSRLCSWRDTTVEELYVYFGLILAMGVVVKSRLEEYWATSPDIFYTPGFSAHMSIDRFLLLCKCIHFNDNRDMDTLSLDYVEAKIFKIKPILSHLNKKFQDMYVPSRNLALDESLIQWKGWLEFSQQIPNKVANRGIKTYEICESQTGYLWRFEVHVRNRQSPQHTVCDPLQAIIPSIVLNLVQGLEHKGYTLWMDNYYNSPCLARRLKCLGFDCVGTLRTDRQFVPRALNDLTKYNMRVGEITGLTSGDVDVMVWRDNSRVAMISTYHGNAQQTLRDETKPILILDYNIMMGGVDKKDQLLAMYPIERKRTKVWYKKLFRRLLNISVLNSYIIHRQSCSSPFTHRNFRQSLIRSLLSFNTSSRSILSSIIPKKVDVSHRLAEFPMGSHQRIRRVCTVCKKKVRTFCVGCDKAVCMDPCFLSMHS